MKANIADIRPQIEFKYTSIYKLNNYDTLTKPSVAYLEVNDASYER